MIEHAVALAAAFDTASAFALSFGIKKFQFAQKEVKLVGEIVGELGRKPNPAICEAISKWHAVKNLKDLQGFLQLCSTSRRAHLCEDYASTSCLVEGRCRFSSQCRAVACH